MEIHGLNIAHFLPIQKYLTDTLLYDMIQVSSRRVTTVYTDYSPFPGFPRHEGVNGHKVVVIEGREKAKDVMRLARENGLTSRDYDGNEIFWIVFEAQPKRVWDFTGKSLRQTLWSGRYPQKDRK
jgi:hypothetical protein